MRIAKHILRFTVVVVTALLLYGVYYAWQAFPIITGYGAKMLCSCTMLAGRPADDVIRNELGDGLLKLGSYVVHVEDSSATATVFGLARRKAIYRKGLGCTLVNGLTEAELRAQSWSIPMRPAVNPDTIPWPSGNLITRVDLSAYDTVLLKQTIDEAFREPGQKPQRRTRAVLIVHNGNLIAERYAPGFSEKSLLTGWSMTKSLTNSIVGALVRDGLISLNTPAPVEHWKEDERAAITLHHLLQASSGLAWEEVYSGPSAATRMLFKERDAGLYACHFPLHDTPGEVFYYSSGTTNIISLIIRKTLGDELYHSYGYEKVFFKADMYSLVMEPDPGGTFVGSSFSFATARDWARFGLLYLNDGYWQGERILPEGWVEYTVTPAKGATMGEYGAQFWLNAGNPSDPAQRTFPDVPSDMFYASGYQGQNLFIIPSENLVVVKLSLSTGNETDDNLFLRDIIQSLPK